MRRRFAAALGLLLAGALPAGAQSAQYAVGRITVLNGSPIRGVGNVILQRSFSPECHLPPTIVGPLSTALAAPTQLAVEIVSCPAGLPPPQVTCRLQVGGVASEVRFLGWQQNLPLRHPELTGVFSLTLDCSVDGQAGEPLATTLYLTYERPTCLVSGLEPPPESWYRTACSWAAGLGLNSPQTDVPHRILRAMYRYGQNHWRYGYCRVVGQDCIFGPTTVSAGPLICMGSLCKCPWNALIEEGDPCNFANCFTFTEILTYMSGMMGVGGFGKQNPEGSRNLGFTTQPWLRSFDPAFPGNLTCGYRNLPCSYLFDIHSLLVHGKVLFDATFGHTFANEEGLIADNVLEIQADNQVFRDFVACDRGTGYGEWTVFQKASLESVCLPDTEGPPAGPETPSALATDLPSSGRQVAWFGHASQIRSSLEFYQDPSQLMTLKVHAQIRVRTAETFVLEGRLERPGTGETVGYVCEEMSLDEGEQQVTLEFQNRQIDEMGSKTPYLVTLALHRARPLSSLGSVKAFIDPRATPVGQPEEP